MILPFIVVVVPCPTGRGRPCWLPPHSIVLEVSNFHRWFGLVTWDLQWNYTSLFSWTASNANALVITFPFMSSFFCRTSSSASELYASFRILEDSPLSSLFGNSVKTFSLAPWLVAWKELFIPVFCGSWRTAPSFHFSSFAFESS